MEGEIEEKGGFGVGLEAKTSAEQDVWRKATFCEGLSNREACGYAVV